MVKAFYNLKTLHELAKSMTETYNALNERRGQSALSYKDKLVFEIFSFGLPLLDDYFNDNLFSIVNYLRFRSILEAGSLMSLGEEKDFKEINLPLFEDQFNIINYRTYFTFTPDFVSLHDLKNIELVSKEKMAEALKADVDHSHNLTSDKLTEKKMPMLLGRDLSESVRTYLGYIFQGIYLRSGEMIHLIDYRDLDDKYAIAFFNDITRMLMKITSEYSFPLTGKKAKIEKKQVVSLINAYEDEKAAYSALVKKLDSRFPSSFIAAAFKRLGQIEGSFENVLAKGRYWEENTLYKILIEFLANVDSVASSPSSLISFNFGEEMNKLGEEERELKFVSMRRNLITPNLLWQHSSLRQIVYSYLDSLRPVSQTYFGLKQPDYLKLKYYEAQASTHGNGYLFYASMRYFAFDKELVMLLDEMIKELVDKIRLTFKDTLDLTVEEEAIRSCLGKKETVLLSFDK
ncbi:MAG: hypothetical protein LKJ88_01865 [Bacilli bacterium]|nr:hypothetical protein [Bacilli bacterium]